MDELKIGDVVELKSGGPKMTIQGIDDMLGVHCNWFKDEKRESSNFNLNTLQIVAQEDTD